MSEIEIGGVKIKASKWLLIIFPIVSTAAGGLWYGFTLWQEFINLKNAVESYEAPNISHLEEKLSVFEERIDGLEIAIETRVAALEEGVSIKINSSLELIDKSEVNIRDIKTTMRSELNSIQDAMTEQDTRNRNIENNVRELLRQFEGTIRSLIDQATNRFQTQTIRVTEALDQRIELVNNEMKGLEERIMRILENPLTGQR